MNRPAIIILSVVAIICTSAIIESNHRTTEAVLTASAKSDQRAIADRTIAAHSHRGKETGELQARIAEAFVHLRELIAARAPEIEITIARDHLAALESQLKELETSPVLY